MGGARETLLDRHGRRIEYIRISLTDRCNFRCPFCMPDEASYENNTDRRLDSGEILRLCGIIARLGVDNFKLTGGEPFMHPEAVAIMKRLKAVPGVNRVTVTTNGSTLDRHGPELAAIGVDGVNISLNGMTDASFAAATGGNFAIGRILDNILLAKRLGLNVKLNMVPLRDINAADIIPYLEFALDNGIYARFIELMPIGQGKHHRGVPQAELRRIIEEHFGPVEIAAGRFGNGPAVYYTLQNHPGKIGYIAAISQRFCDACNRIRLTSTGFLRTCLHHDHGMDLAGPMRSGEDDDAIAGRIRAIVADKPGQHHFDGAANAGTPADIPMFRIGG